MDRTPGNATPCARDARPPGALVWRDPASRAFQGLALVLGLVVFALGPLAISPHAHAALHADASAHDHVCAITLAAVGFCDTSAASPEAGAAPLSCRPHLGGPVPFFWSAPCHWHPLAHAPPAGRN